jgi:hypothetical protein
MMFNQTDRNASGLRLTLQFACCVMFFSWAAPTTAAIPNGGFELNTVNTGSGGYYFGDVADGWTKFDGVYFNPTPDMFDNNGVGGELPGSFTAFIGTAAYQGTKFAAVGGWATDPNLPGFSEGIASTPVPLAANQTYTLQLAMMHDSTNSVSYNFPSPLTVRLRQGGSGPGTIVGLMSANTLPKTWQLRTLNFQVPTAGLYEIVLSNESVSIGSYLGIDAVELVVPEPGGLATALGMIALGQARRRRRQ